MKNERFIPPLIVAALLGAIACAPALAQHTETPGIDQSQQYIRQQIEHGIATGRIAPHEARELHRREREIRMMESAMKRDGIVHPEERRQLRYEVDDLRSLVDRKLSGQRASAYGAFGAPGIERTQERIRARIAEGRRSGHITRREAQRLYERERHFAQHEAAARADGMLSREERRQLRTELAALGDEVAQMIDNDHRQYRR